MDILDHPIKLIKKSKRILITTHIHPDADGLGSLFALSEALENIGKDTTLYLDMGTLQAKYAFLQEKSKIQTPKTLKLSRQFDLLIVVDAHSLNRIHPKVSENLEKFKEILL